MCAKEDENGQLVGRVYPHITKIFQRCSASTSLQKTSTGLLLLVQFNLWSCPWHWRNSLKYGCKIRSRMITTTTAKNSYIEPCVVSWSRKFYSFSWTLLKLCCTIRTQVFTLSFGPALVGMHTTSCPSVEFFLWKFSRTTFFITSYARKYW